MKQKQKAKDKPKGSPKQQRPEVPMNKLALIAGGILLATLICYIPSLHNDFLRTWDDQAYVTANELVKDASFSGIQRIFKEDAGMYANYHPLTIISLALNYHEGVGPFPFHLTNLILHLLNTLLVFVFIYLLSDKRVIAAGICALWFGIHPMHVESVAWISERKDVLYTFFYLLALIAYWFYVKRDLAMKFFIAAVSLFVLSALSKAMAVSLPVVMLFVDYWAGRKFSMRIMLEKVPFVVISIILGIIAMNVQAAGGATSSITFPFFNKVLHAAYGFTMYIVKLFAPADLLAFYPYPYPLVNSGWVLSTIPGQLYVTLLGSLVIGGSAVYMHLKKKPLAKVVVFGLGFYLASIALVLQFLPVGRTIMSDRYSYIPYIGLFFVIGWVVQSYWDRKQAMGKLLAAVAAVYSAAFMYLTMQQVKVWKNDDTLWSHTINAYPDDNRMVLPYFNRAAYYFDEKRYDEALADYLVIARHDPKNVGTLERLGRLYGQHKNDLPNAILYFEKAYQANPQSMDALRGLATAYGMKGDYPRSVEFSLKAIALSPNDGSLYMNAAASYQFMGDAAKAAEFKQKGEQLMKK